MTIWYSCLNTLVNVSWVGAYIWDFFQLQKKEINDKGGICVRRLVIIRDEVCWWGLVGQKRTILA